MPTKLLYRKVRANATSPSNRQTHIFKCVCYKMLYLLIYMANPITLKCFPTYFDVEESIYRLGCCPFADMRPYFLDKTAIYIGLHHSRWLPLFGVYEKNTREWLGVLLGIYVTYWESLGGTWPQVCTRTAHGWMYRDGDHALCCHSAWCPCALCMTWRAVTIGCYRLL